MADYTPVFLPGDVIPLTASGTIAGGDLVGVSGSGTVAKLAFSAAPATTCVGVAATDAIANGRVSVIARGVVHESVAQGTVTAGDLVTTPITGDTAGAQVKTLAAANLGATWDASAATAANLAINSGRAILGIALTTASNPVKVRWMQT